jgi:FKBP-type peptidyl-prolyl cis-trans isomerase
MKRIIAPALCAALVLALAAPAAAQASKADVSYALGMLIGKSAKSTNIEVDIDSLVAGVKDSMSGAKTRFTEAQAGSMAQAAAQAAQDKQGAASLQAGRTFLENNKKKAGVKTTASGLQYEVIKEGSGPKPKATDTVTVHYEGKLTSGKVFDSSIARKEPATFPLNGVIKGWTEGLQLMGVGAKYRFYIPSELGYGASGAGSGIGPNEVLIFEVELISIGKK